MNNYNVLIAEDERKTLEGIQKVLQSSFYEDVIIYTAENGQEALNIFKSCPVDLLISDIQMPGMTGLELIKAVKEYNSSVQSIILTGHAEFEYAKAALKLGVRDYLMKPVGKKELLIQVKRVFEDIDQNRKLEKSRRLIKQFPLFFKEDDLMINNETIQVAVSFINQNISTPLSLDVVADHAHVNKSYFSTLFKEVVGITYSEYLTKIRIKKAMELLIDTNLRVYEVADKVGYTSSKYFINVFRTHVKMTPSEFKNQLIQ